MKELNVQQADHQSSEIRSHHNATLMNLTQLCEAEPALTIGGVRHLLFTKGHDLPGVYRFGRKLLFDRAEFMEGIKQGYAAQIGGRGEV
ncbi:hypothetical protein QQF73_03435 [Marinobacter sp. M216]|uniref:DNA-binding protein n=1 Tax=Marinobacter albus TaxID=3030833 RepID=A0ABT7H8I4_9GAMM|nr:hypothetical protein [Marinobacter sp. M216]MDK9556665.1 hypothetical protein [Marinobacter sp. M216]